MGMEHRGSPQVSRGTEENCRRDGFKRDKEGLPKLGDTLTDTPRDTLIEQGTDLLNPLKDRASQSANNQGVTLGDDPKDQHRVIT